MTTLDCRETIIGCVFQYWLPRIVYTAGCGIGTIYITIDNDDNICFGKNLLFVPKWTDLDTEVRFSCLEKLHPKREVLLADTDGCIFVYDDQYHEKIKQREELKVPFFPKDMHVIVDPVYQSFLHMAVVGDGKLSILKIDVTGRVPVKYFELAKSEARGAAWSPGDQLAINVLYSDCLLRQWRLDKDTDTWVVWSVHPVAGQGMDICFIRDQMSFVAYATTKSVVAEYFQQPGEPRKAKR
ncbi:hypothetical protein Pmani_007534 [Petrolisthes manimaculis]|uniref:Uncharacterized protein n=1 Tax=Petrolisthes manimaculis TaxID=1843537 RepID=A0AAE1Q8Q6_9EUCA|nr:hypothetical protein Pmani_007534 [Petrolisthes manimaculis]